MFREEKVRLILLEEFANAQVRNPKYSMRAYAKKVGVGQSAISEILSGKRPITRKTAEKILIGLDKSPIEISEVLQSEPINQQKYKSLDMDTYHMIADWYYYAILSLAETVDFESSVDWIAKRLGISISTAGEATQRLLRLGLLERHPKTGKLKATGDQFEAISAIAHPALKKACRQNLELAVKALDESNFEERDFTAITLCFNPSKMLEAKKLIKNFRRNFCRAMESHEKKEVYKLSLQLFPLSKGKK